jgi:transcriptional regulator with GAF, ATPase, and Fis domain
MAQTLMTQGQGTRTPQANLRQLVEAYERRLIIEALVRAHGNQRRAAAELGCLPTDPQREDAAAWACGPATGSSTTSQLA